MTLYVYYCAPIDFWEGWSKLSKPKALTHKPTWSDDDPDWFTRSAWALFTKAQPIAKKIYWEGDIANGPFTSALPTGECESAPIVAWKQANNGSTFVASYLPLPWLSTQFDTWTSQEFPDLQLP